ncbi:MAG: hypothetical protein LBG46_06400, partial [Elusimicrobiota bacterium]|nr:hypothetical protein [Elusimicrobiota bacterium]
MSKLIVILSVMFAGINIWALEIEVSDSHIFGSEFWRNSLSISTRPYYPFFVGAEFDLTEHKNFK